MIAMKTLAVIGSISLVGVGAAAAVLTNLEPDTVVAAIVDGDTIDVSRNGEQKRVRLLNVDTPETVHPDEMVQCMGPEAAAFLEELLPVGTVVDLQYDEERTDQYGRELAGVFVEGVLVNAEIARAGLGAAVLFGPNDRFYPDVLAAQNEAQAAERGLYDPNAECTFPAKLNQFSEQADQLLSQEPPDVQDIPAMESYLAEIAALGLVGEALAELLDDEPRSLLPVIHRDNNQAIRSLEATQQRLSSERESVQADIEAEKERLEAERLEAERLEAERREAERREAERLEAERREAERLEAERQAAAQQNYSSGGSGGSSSGASGGSNSGAPGGSNSGGSGGSGAGGYDGYTGCRAYGGGYVPNAVDNQGRPYTRIDCATKMPLP